MSSNLKPAEPDGGNNGVRRSSWRFSLRRGWYHLSNGDPVHQNQSTEVMLKERLSHDHDSLDGKTSRKSSAEAGFEEERCFGGSQTGSGDSVTLGGSGSDGEVRGEKNGV